MNTWVIADIHGSFKALKQVFERAPIKEGDTIIQLGDICDGWSEVYECVDLLISMKEKYNMIFIKGNHDEWFHTFLSVGVQPVHWLQGGEGTLTSYCRNAQREIKIYSVMGGYNSNLTNYDIPKSHIDFFNNQLLWYIDEQDRFFVHGGFNREESIYTQPDSDFYWDRDLWRKAMSCSKDQKLNTIEGFKEVFIGHTTTLEHGVDTPITSGGITNLDTGAGFNGKLTIMNVDTKEYYQSDNVKDLYPNERGRG